MIDFIEKLHKEWRVIKSAPWSFSFVCIITIAACLGGFKWYYGGRLSDLNQDIAHWKSEADYWKGLAGHSNIPSINIDGTGTPKSKPSVSPTPSKAVHAALSRAKDSPPQTINAPNGIAIGGGNVSNPVVNNYMPPQRILSANQRQIFITSLKPYCPFEVAVRHVPGNSESQQYADQIGAAIKEAGCTLRRPKFLIDEHSGTGVFVSIHDNKKIPLAANALVGAFQRANIPIKSNIADVIEEGAVYIFVELNDIEGTKVP